MESTYDRLHRTGTNAYLLSGLAGNKTGMYNLIRNKVRKTIRLEMQSPSGIKV